MAKIGQKSYLLLSGGQDSFVCLLWSLQHFNEVECISVDYGQRHAIELKYAKRIANYLDVKHSLYRIADWMKQLSVSALMDEDADVNVAHTLAKHLPSSFVPARNGILLTILGMHAYNRLDKTKDNQALHLVIGACQTDYSGYPDCRDKYIKAKGLELSHGFDLDVVIHTPLMWQTKADTFAMAHRYNELDACLQFTLTCYEGSLKKNDFGFGCGKCSACLLRKKGYEDFVQKHSAIKN